MEDTSDSKRAQPMSNAPSPKRRPRSGKDPGSTTSPSPLTRDPVGEGLACLDEASRPCRSEKVSLGSYAESVQAHREAYPSDEELIVEERVRAVREQPVFEGLVDPGRRG